MCRERLRDAALIDPLLSALAGDEFRGAFPVDGKWLAVIDEDGEVKRVGMNRTADGMWHRDDGVGCA
jgi:hypothetical protein